VGYVLGADDALLARIGHLGSAQTRESGLRQERAQMGDDPGAVVIARGLAGGEEYARIGVGSDGYKFIVPVQW